MADNWDDSDDEWDADDDEIDAKLGIKNSINKTTQEETTKILSTFADEEDLALLERVEDEKIKQIELKKKGNALVAKKKQEQERKEELELAKKAMELEAEKEASMTPDELREHQRRRIEEADNALTDDLFGTIDDRVGRGSTVASSSNGDAVATATASAGAGDKVIMKDLKDHLKHARRISESLKLHGKIHLSTSFFKEAIQQSKDVMDEDSVMELIKTLNIIKNEKMIAAKRKVKGQAQKSKKIDKTAEAKARKIQIETFGDNNQYDQYDAMGEDYEDAFF